MFPLDEKLNTILENQVLLARMIDASSTRNTYRVGYLCLQIETNTNNVLKKEDNNVDKELPRT